MKAAVIVFIFLPLTWVSEVFSQTKWFKYEGNPVLDVGPPGSWDAGAVQGPRVIRLGDTLKMWYEGLSPTNFSRIGYAWSTDNGITWKRHFSNPVMIPTQAWELDWCFSPYVIFTGSHYKMWYTGADGFGQIGYATSRDGIRWTKHSGNPVLRSGPSRWDAPRIEWPSVVRPDSSGGFRMWYGGWSEGFNSAQIGYATATDETTWVKLDQSNPVLASTAESWDAPFLRSPRVIFDGHRYEMWYSGGIHFMEKHHIGYATSSDGITWTKFDAPILQPGRPDPWDAKAVLMPEVIFDGIFYHMWYVGYDGSKGRIGYAVSPKGAGAEISPSYKYLKPASDTVFVKVTVDNRVLTSRAGNRLDFSARITAAKPHYSNPLEMTGLDLFNHVATLSLFDDGAHGDDLAGDGLFANQWVPKEEQLYVVDLKMKPDKVGTRQFKIDHAAVFTTIGPITVGRVEFLGDSTANPGDTILVKLTLRNHGSSTTAPSIQASLSTADASIMTITEMSPYYWDIPAGKTSTTEGFYRILINPYFSSETETTIKVTISCWDIPLWYDGFTIRITPPWWQTRWAYVGYVLLAGMTVLGAYRYNIRRMKVRNELKMKALEADQLHEVDRMKSRFFANISHEFRTPLTLIQGPIEKMLSNETKENVKDEYKMVLRNSQRLQQLVNQLLDLSRIESGQMKLRAREMDIVEIVRGIAASFESLAKRNKIDFILEFLEEPTIGWFDRDAVEKIVINLLSNAFKFTAEGGKVTVILSRRNSLPPSVEISVTDTGFGIAPDQLDKIFDRFYQVDASQTREQEGTGIGLALTKELVELHKGKITVRSKLGKGTTFTASLPLGKEHLSRVEIADGDEAKRSVTPPALEIEETGIIEKAEEDFKGDEALPLLLVVEDNADMRKYIRTSLEDQYRLNEALNGEEGIQRTIEIIPDLVISDVMMPKMDGFALCEKLKTDERTSHIPIILLTAKASAESKIEGLETGADDYLVKPFDAKELLVRVKNLIEQRQRLREKFKHEVVIRPSGIAATSLDEAFLLRVKETLEKNIGDEHYSVEQLAYEVNLSYTQIHRKLRALTNMSTGRFIRWFRLQRAMELLTKNTGTVAEIAYMVGFGSPAYFTKCFREEFGLLPSEAARREEV